MIECLHRAERIARKPHICNYCGDTINKGEKYDYGKYKDDVFYEWKCHLKCGFISAELWDLADPDMGMNEDDFYDACREFCHVFVCPDCPTFNKEYRECDEDHSFCLDKIYDLLQTHRLTKSRDKHGMFCFKIAPREQE